MALSAATITLRLLASVGDNEPAEIGTIAVPLTLTATLTSDRSADVTVGTPDLRKALKRALRAAAREI